MVLSKRSLGIRGARFSWLEKGISPMEKGKTRIYPLVLHRNWRYWYKLKIMYILYTILAMFIEKSEKQWDTNSNYHTKHPNFGFCMPLRTKKKSEFLINRLNPGLTRESIKWTYILIIESKEAKNDGDISKKPQPEEAPLVKCGTIWASN